LNHTREQTVAPAVGAIAPWFGSNRLLAPAVGQELAGCGWVGVPFAGGMSELAHIKASTLVVNDLHRAVVNLATVAAHAVLGPRLYRRLRRLPFHPDILKQAQLRCRAWQAAQPESPDLDWALDYFVACWMGRSAKSGTLDEFNGGLAIRWNANGGGSATRYQSAVRSLLAWRTICARCDFVVMDAFAFLDRCQDSPGHGIYCDPPFPGLGDKYRHRFLESDHRRLAGRLAEYRHARVVCRFYDHPLIERLYCGDRWVWRTMAGRNQRNAERPKVLILNGPSLAQAGDPTPSQIALF